MITVPKINCKHHDKFGGCSKKPRSLFGLFKASCCESSIDGYVKCDVADRYRRPNAPPSPIPRPKARRR